VTNWEENMNGSKLRKIYLAGWRVIKAPIPAKRGRRIYCLTIAVVVLLGGANAEAKKNTGDWRVVENLEPGTHVIVKAQHKFGCTYEGANEEELICWVHLRRSFRMVSIKIPRAEIREVRTLPNQAKDAWIGVGIGAAAGAVVVGIKRGGAYAFLGGVAGALPGALAGAIVLAVQFLIQRGKIIYKQ